MLRSRPRRFDGLLRSSFRRKACLAVGALSVAAVLLLSSLRYPEEALARHGFESTRILASDGSILHEIRGEHGGYARWVSLDEIASSVLLATLSSEDAYFYEHPGIDLASIGRALRLNLREGRLGYGASTITQQLAKLLDPEPRTLGGKLREAVAAVRLEQTLEKDEILTQYLNRAYYGRNAYGIEAAAQRFFGKPASELTLGEGSFLSILPRRPSGYDPDHHLDRALERRRHVLDHMVRRGWIHRDEARAAATEPLAFIDPHRKPAAHHFVDAALLSDELEEAQAKGQVELRTALDRSLQATLEARLRLHLETVADRAVSQAGIVVLSNDTGEVLAMVGSRRYGEAEVSGAVNATTARRQPGSTLKPFIYALAIEDGAHPATPILDAPIDLAGYRPHSLGEHRGWVSLEEALGGSLNVPAVRLAHQLGLPRVVELLKNSGLGPIDERAGLPIALGATPVRLVDLAGAYAALARGGVHRPSRLLSESPSPTERVLSEETAYLVTRMMSSSAARRATFGFETDLDFPFEVAVKTGTSQSYCDNLVVGYTPSHTVAVWVGNFDGRPMRGVLSIEGAAPLFRDAMLAAMAEQEPARFARPPGIVSAELCADTGRPVSTNCARRTVTELAGRHLGQGGITTPSDTRIIAPHDDARMVLDPLLPRTSQHTRVEVRSPAARIRLFVNDALYAELSPPFRTSLLLEPGRHRLRAEDDEGAFPPHEIEVSVAQPERSM
ncbi:MAG: transglycosylase domain-containing protein [Myxococcota bacterium]